MIESVEVGEGSMVDRGGRDEVTFSFGANWRDFVDSMSEERIEAAIADLEDWLGAESIRGRTVIDVGSGSGIHSLSFLSFGPSRLVSFDYDPLSVESTRLMRERAGAPESWEVLEGSVLDPDFLSTLGRFDIVYSWGVLHHTGAMWDAIGNASDLVTPGGRFLIAIYQRGPNYERDLALKRRYNAASDIGKRLMEARFIARRMLSYIRHGRNPLRWFRTRDRGMSPYHDVVDWLGGLPYEVADKEEIVTFCEARGFTLDRTLRVPEGGCSYYLLTRSAPQA